MNEPAEVTDGSEGVIEDNDDRPNGIDEMTDERGGRPEVIDGLLEEPAAMRAQHVNRIETRVTWLP